MEGGSGGCQAETKLSITEGHKSHSRESGFTLEQHGGKECHEIQKLTVAAVWPGNRVRGAGAQACPVSQRHAAPDDEGAGQQPRLPGVRTMPSSLAGWTGCGGCIHWDGKHGGASGWWGGTDFPFPLGDFEELPRHPSRDTQQVVSCRDPGRSLGWKYRASQALGWHWKWGRGRGAGAHSG